MYLRCQRSLEGSLVSEDANHPPKQEEFSLNYFRKFMDKISVRGWRLLERLVDAKVASLGDRLLAALDHRNPADPDFFGGGSGQQLRDPGNHFTVLQIGITDACNLVCRHCGRLPGQSKIFGTLPLPTFARYLANFSPKWFDELLISEWGEPTIVPNLLDYLYLAKKTGWDKVQFITNGTCRDEALLDEIVAQRLLDQLVVSIEGADPKLYERIRRTKFAVFDRFIRTVTRLREYYESPMQFVFSVTCMKDNLDDLINIMKLAAEIKVNRVYMVHIQPYPAGDSVDGKLCVPEQSLDNVERKKVLATFREIIDYAQDQGILLVLPEACPELTGSDRIVLQPSSYDKLGTDQERRGEIAKEFTCPEPFRWVQVDQSGNVYPCCRVNKLYSLGNINNLDFYSIYHNLKYEKLRRSLRHRSEPLDICKGCGVLAGKSL